MKNKSILFGLLATTALMLGACNGNQPASSEPSQPSSEPAPVTSSEPESSEPEVVDYGTLEAPISVEAANKIIEKELKLGDKTEQPLVVKGVMKLDGKDGYNKFYKNYTFYLHDEDKASEKVYAYQISNLPELEQIASENDTIIISGYVVDYKGTYELSSTKVDNVEVKAYVQKIVTVGTSAINVAAVEHGTVSELPASAANGTPVEFTLTPEAGYKAGIVRVNGVAVEPDEGGKYKFVVSGDSTVRAEFVEESKAPANYGSEEAPLSVTEALALATEECYDTNIFTAKPVVVKGLVKATKTLGNYSSFRIDILDEANPEVSLLVYTLLPGDYTELPAGYTIVVSGYIKNYNSTIEYDVYYAAGVGPTIISLTSGTVAITVEAEHATVTGLPETAAVGAELSFTVEVESGYQIDAVKANNKALTPEEGVYKFTVEGPMTILVETSPEGTVNNDITINSANLVGYDGSADVGYNSTAATKDVSGVTFEYLQMGAYQAESGALRIRIKNGSKGHLLNTTALPAAIEKIEITLSDSKPAYDNNPWLSFTFGTSADALSGEIQNKSIAGQYNYTITPAATDATFFKMELLDSHTFYFDSIVLVLAD